MFTEKREKKNIHKHTDGQPATQTPCRGKHECFEAKDRNKLEAISNYT